MPIKGLAFIVLYVGLDWVSFIYEFAPYGFTPWNPQAGLSLAFLLRSTPLNVLWLFPAALLADVVVRGWPASLEASILSAFALSAGYALTAHLLLRFFSFGPFLSRLYDVLVLTAAGAVAALVVAVLYVGIYVATGLVALGDFPEAMYRHWIGDVIGIAVVTPLLLRFPRPAGNRQDWPAGWLEAGLQVTAILLANWIVFLPETDEFKFFYLLFLPVIWAAIRYGLDGAAIAVAATQVCLIGAIHFRHFDPEIAVALQVLMLTLAFTGLLIGAVVSERERTQTALHESEARLREHHAELAHFARNSALGEMASTLAHEISQPLSATATYLNACSRLLRAPTVDLGTVREAIIKAEIQAQRAGHILAGLRDFLYRGETHLAPITTSELVRSVAALAVGEIERIGATMSVIDRAEGTILADRIQLEQALLNLVRNAAEALSEMPQAQRQLTLETRNSADTVEISVIDTGPGVTPDITDRMFQPFVSTKPHGMGLGLTIVRSIVEAHGGHVHYEPWVGGGSVFRFILPRNSES